MKNLPAPGRRRIIAVAVATAAVSLLAVATGSAATREKPTPQPRPEVPARADRDGNKIFDDLEAKLDATTSDADVPVIVSLTVPPSKARLKELEKEAGSFAVGKTLSTVDA